MNSAPLTTLAVLKASGRTVTVPFSIALPDHSILLCDTILRLLPEKRIVLRGTHNQQTVLVKLFFDADNWQKEINGFEKLQHVGINTPALLMQCPLEQGGVCLFTFIDNAQALDALWQQSNETEKRGYLDRLLPCLQNLWQHQFLQRDLHLGNFLLQTQEDGSTALWLLDPASCQHFSHPHEQQKNLALLLAQLPLADWDFALQHLQGDAAINALAKQQWRQRLQHYLKKILRDCTEVADLSPHNGLRILAQRRFLTSALREQLKNPAALTQNATILKNGNSAKVFRIEVDGKAFVVKQYINKDWLRKLRRAFRPTRAARSWHYAHALTFAGVRVPHPVALIEQK
ncbi:MAG TPA: lipopolysaccharide kinase InaA family protein, partial [Pseudomonadales bacterium]|nr:lipopolysaccharide kinase InaA family protein [Pseudomonadales bacterium]